MGDVAIRMNNVIGIADFNFNVVMFFCLKIRCTLGFCLAVFQGPIQGAIKSRGATDWVNN